MEANNKLYFQESTWNVFSLNQEDQAVAQETENTSPAIQFLPKLFTGKTQRRLYETLQHCTIIM